MNNRPQRKFKEPHRSSRLICMHAQSDGTLVRNSLKNIGAVIFYEVIQAILAL